MGPFECPRAPRRVNQAAFAVGTLAVAGACLKIANAGSCRLDHKLVIVVLFVEKPPSTGGRWHAGQTYRATKGGKERRREQARRRRERERQRATPAEPAPPTSPVEPALPGIEAQTISDSALMIPEDCDSVGQRPDEILPESCGLPCSRPGCYVLFVPSPRSPDRHFCSGSCRQALRRVRQREARLRRRRRRGARPMRRPRGGPPPATPVMSSRP